MNSLQLRTAFRRLFAQWYLLGLAARCLQFTLIFEAVSHGVGAAWMGAVMAASSVACAVFTIYAGRLYNRFGPSPLNRCAALCCAGAGFLATQHEAPAALAVAWMLTGMTLMLAATAGYRGIGGLFGAADRVSRFSRMCLLSNVSEIAMPVAIGALFSQAPDLMPFIVLAVSLALFFLSSGVSRSDLRAHGLVESTDLLVNIRRLAGSGPLLAGVVAGSGPLLAGVVAGSGVNALFCILDILVPTAGGGMGLTTIQTGTLLSACALAQVAASSLLSVRANHRTLLPQLRNALLLGGVALSGAALADGFASFLLVVSVAGFGFGLVRPLSMSTIFQYAPPESVGDIVGMRFMLNNLGRIMMSLFMAAGVGGFMSSTVFLSTLALIVLVVTIGASIRRGPQKRGGED